MRLIPLILSIVITLSPAGGGELLFRRDPCVRFTGPDSAELSWVLNGKPVTVYYGADRCMTNSVSGTGSVMFYDLKPKTVYYCQIGDTTPFEFETTFNPGVVYPELAGYCVAAETDLQTILDLVHKSSYSIIVLERNPTRTDKLRHFFYRQGLYGTRVNVYQVDSYNRLPFRDGFANVVIAPKGNPEFDRIKRPIKPPKGSGEWTHQYGDAANRAFTGESLGGKTRTDGLHVQWMGRPGGDFGLDRNPRMPAPLAAGGRLFHQGKNRIISMDQYNGAVLWNLEIPSLRRVNIPRDGGNWCTDGNTLYLTIHDQLWQIDTATGKIRDSQTLKKYFQPLETPHEWGYVATADGIIFGSSVKKGTLYTKWFGKDMWYDKPDSPGTAKVSSDALFTLDPETGNLNWIYQNGAIINPTIAVDGGKVYFVEGRHPEIAARAGERIHSSKLWENLFLVALDAQTGKKYWEQPLKIEPGDVVFYGQSSEEGVVLTTSAENFYHIYLYSHTDGRQLWHASHRWTANNHSGHMQHPVIVNDIIFLEPKGYSMKTGEEIFSSIGKREGCHTYLAVTGALIYRGRNRCTSMWDFKTRQTTSWSHLRPSCWLSIVPAGGMLLMPESGGGCSCGRWIETSIGFSPVENGK